MNTSGYEKTIAIDFDGTINDYVGGWISEGIIHENDRPIDGALDFIRQCINSGATVCILSVRCNTSNGRLAILEYLLRFGLEANYCEKIQYHGKPPAMVYIDDRAIRFFGDWKFTKEEFESFEPWYYKERGR